jgi:hypothetical protein
MGPLSPDFPEWIWACVTLLRPSASIWYQILDLALFSMNPENPVAKHRDGAELRSFR